MPDSEWIHVRRGRRSKPLRNHHEALGPHVASEPPSSTAKPLSELQADHAKFKSQFNDAPFRSLVTANKSACHGITNAVCLGIGTFDPDDGGYDAKRRTFIQFVAFLAMVDEIESTLGAKIEVIFQEPIFTASDEALIASLGHRVVPTPQATEQVTSTTFLFAVHLYRPIYAAALQSHLPAVFVGTGWDVWDHVILDKSDDLANMSLMHTTHKCLAFPQDDRSTAFSSTSVYFNQSPTLADAPHQELELPESKSPDKAAQCNGSSESTSNSDSDSEHTKETPELSAKNRKENDKLKA